MQTSFEILLILGILGFYLYDSAILLFANEVVFVKSYFKWSASFPTSRWRVMKKLLLFPNPLTPFNPIFLLTWTTLDAATKQNQTDLAKLLAAITLLQFAVITLMISLLIALPLTIYKLGMGTPTLIVVSFIYLNILCLLCIAYIKKDDLKLNNKAFIKLAFEALACPPFALNFIRHISLRHSFHSTSVGFAMSVLRDNDLKTFIEGLDEKLAEELELENEEDNHRSIEIIGYRQKIKGMIL